MLLTLLILAHSWYPYYCCGDGHCHPTPCELISSTGKLWHWRNLQFTAEQVLPSLDAECHVCHDMWNGQPIQARCLFVKGTV